MGRKKKPKSNKKRGKGVVEVPAHGRKKGGK